MYRNVNTTMYSNNFLESLTHTTSDDIIYDASNNDSDVPVIYTLDFIR